MLENNLFPSKMLTANIHSCKSYFRLIKCKSPKLELIQPKEQPRKAEQGEARKQWE